jgi:hypothetical protein
MAPTTLKPGIKEIEMLNMVREWKIVPLLILLRFALGPMLECRYSAHFRPEHVLQGCKGLLPGKERYPMILELHVGILAESRQTVLVLCQEDLLFLPFLAGRLKCFNLAGAEFVQPRASVRHARWTKQFSCFHYFIRFKQARIQIHALIILRKATHIMLLHCY